MRPPEIQFLAPDGLQLVDALRHALGQDGRAPSRRRAGTWIEKGCVRVDGEVRRDPRCVPCAGARIDLAPPSGGDPVGASGDARRTAPLPVHHLDRHLLVVEYVSPLPAADAAHDDIDSSLVACLEAAAVVASDLRPRPVPPPHPLASGILVAALGAESEVRLQTAFEKGAASLEVLVLLERLPEGADVEVLAERPEGLVGRTAVAAGGVPALEVDLEASGTPPAPWPVAGPRGRPALHVASVHLPHPRTGRSLTWRGSPPPWFA